MYVQSEVRVSREATRARVACIRARIGGKCHVSISFSKHCTSFCIVALHVSLSRCKHACVFSTRCVIRYHGSYFLRTHKDMGERRYPRFSPVAKSDASGICRQRLAETGDRACTSMDHGSDTQDVRRWAILDGCYFTESWKFSLVDKVASVVIIQRLKRACRRLAMDWEGCDCEILVWGVWPRCDGSQ
jgi:hypothetical protein